MELQEQILRLQSLFRGNSRVCGLASRETVKDAKGKVEEVKKGFSPGPVTDQHWKNHLNGSCSLGLVPITDYSECKFAAIDVDCDIMESAKVTLASLCATVQGLTLPMVVCRSKSGGAHIYVFFKDMVPADKVRLTFKRISDVMGLNSHRPVEFYPHTGKLDTESNGKYINLPYFNGESTERYGFDHLGERLSLDQFIVYAEKISVLGKDFIEWKVPATITDVIRDVINNGPPCLQTIYDMGIADGTKNDMLLQYGILFKKYNAQTFCDNVEIINQTRTDGKPHDLQDLQNTMKSLKKKNMHYSCSHPCMAAICAKSLCQTRKYGIRPTVEVPAIKKILQWGANDEYFELLFENDSRIKILIADFIRFDTLREALVQKLHLYIPEPKRHDWQEWVMAMMTKVERVAVPVEFNIEHAIKNLIIEFATSRGMGNKLEELLVSKPVREGNFIIMRQKDIQAEMQKKRLPGYVENLELSIVKNDLNGSMTVKEVQGHIIPVFVIPDPKIDMQKIADKVTTPIEANY